MINKLKRFSREILTFILIMTVAVTVMDWYRKPEPPKDLKDLKLVTIENVEININKISKEKPLLIYFWGSWCSICKLTTPTVNDLEQSGYNVITVALRSGQSDKIKKYLSRKKFTFPVINDPKGSISRQWKISVTPTYAIVYKGKVKYSTTGWTSSIGLKARLLLAQL